MPKAKPKKPEKKIKKSPTYSNSVLFYFFSGFLILFIPVFHLPKALDEALMPRILALSIFSVVMALILFGSGLYKRFDFAVLRQKVFLALAGFLLITLISVAFAFNIRESYFDIVRTFLLVAVSVYAAVIFLNHPNWQEKLPKLIVVAALFALAVGSYQYYKEVILATKPFLEDGRPVIYKVFGMMYHKNEYSSALLWMLPFLAYGIYRFRGGWQIVSILTVLLVLIMIVLVKTRAVWVGIALAMFVIAIILIFFARKLEFPIILRNLMAAAMIVGILGVVTIFSMEKPKDRYSLPGRIRSITETTSPDNIHRINVWKTTLKMIKKKPFTGWGAGNWNLEVAYYFDGKFTEVPQLNWARPHNDYLWVAAEKGVIGLLVYLLLFGFTIFYLLKVLARSQKMENRMLALFLLGGIISYLGVSFFNFPYERPNHQVYLALMLAGAAVLYHQLDLRPAFKPGRLAALIPLLAFSVFGVIFGSKTVQQESELKYSLSAYYQGNWQTMLQYAQRAYNPLKSLDQLSNPPEYYEGMALAKLNRHQEAIVAYEKAYAQFPNSVWITNWMGQSYYMVGRYEDALYCLNKVLHIIPHLKEARISLSATYYQMGEYQKSYDALEAIPGWESDEAIIYNMNALKRKMGQENITR